MCDEAVRREASTLRYVPDHFNTKRMCQRAVENKPDILEFVPDHLKTQEMCEKVVEVVENCPRSS